MFRVMIHVLLLFGIVPFSMGNSNLIRNQNQADLDNELNSMMQEIEIAKEFEPEDQVQRKLQAQGKQVSEFDDVYETEKAIKAKVDKEQGFKIFLSNCKMRKTPDRLSPSLGNIRQGKKLWVEQESSDWFKVFRKSGIAFVHSICF